MTAPTDSGFQPDDAPAATPTPAAMPLQLPQAAAVADDIDEGDLDGDDFDPDRRVRRARNEARGLRGRLRDTEAERDGLLAVVDGLRRGEVERLAATELVDARDLLDRHAVAEFLDEAGRVDPAKVSTAAKALIADRPHVAAPPVVTVPPTNRPLESLKPGGSPQRQPEPTTWQSALGGLVG